MNMTQTQENTVPHAFNLLSSVSIDGNNALSIALTQSRCKSISRQIFTMWPNLKVASIKLAEITTALHPTSENQLLLAVTLKRAFNAFRSNQGKDVERASEFLQILLTAADEIIKFQLLGYKSKGAYVVWEPFSEPIEAWIKRNEIVQITWQENTHEHLNDTFQWILAGKILTYSDSQMVLKYKKKPKKGVPKLCVVGK